MNQHPWKDLPFLSTRSFPHLLKFQFSCKFLPISSFNFPLQTISFDFTKSTIETLYLTLCSDLFPPLQFTRLSFVEMVVVAPRSIVGLQIALRVRWRLIASRAERVLAVATASVRQHCRALQGDVPFQTAAASPQCQCDSTVQDLRINK